MDFHQNRLINECARKEKAKFGVFVSYRRTYVPNKKH